MKSIALLACLLSASFLNSCGQDSSDSDKKGPQIKTAICRLTGTKGNEAVTGYVSFTQKKDGVHIKAEVSGLTPGKHGFHIHEFGDVNCDDGKCTGGHFNPTGKQHGSPDTFDRHVGDLGNLTADDSGKASHDQLDKVISLNGPNSIIGRAIILHSGEDDLTSQPTGAAGSRVASGVIGIAKD